jgi:serine/threonine protein kinase
VRVGWAKNNKHVQYAIKTMKKAEIINSKHVDHIENEKRILEKIQHPFVVSIFSKVFLIQILFESSTTMVFCKMTGIYIL